jgi:monoterpene epsilon-lactone hydrolase
LSDSAQGDDSLDQSEIEAVRAMLGSKPRPVGWAARRARLDEVGAYWPVAEDVELAPVDLDGVPGEWSIVPGSDPSRVLLFFHGGGYCSGSIHSHRRMASEAGRAAGVRTLAVGYRLAPEHPFPAARDDALTAWRCAWLVSPWTDLTMSGATMAAKDEVDPLMHKAYLQELADAYTPAGMDAKDPQISVVHTDLGGLPPTLIQVGSEETLLDDATRFATAAGAAGVPVTLEIWPHMIHAWHVWNARLNAGQRALVSAGAFLRRHL